MMAREHFPPAAYSLFLRGFDTVEIGKRLGISENVASRILNEERSKANGRPSETCPSPYQYSGAQIWRDKGVSIREGRL